MFTCFKVMNTKVKRCMRACLVGWRWLAMEWNVSLHCLFVCLLSLTLSLWLKIVCVCNNGWWQSWNDPLSGYSGISVVAPNKRKWTKWTNPSTRQSQNTTSFRANFSMRTNGTFRQKNKQKKIESKNIDNGHITAKNETFQKSRSI